MSLTVLITRPQPSADEFADILRPQLPAGVRILTSPLMQIAEVETGPVEFGKYAGCLVTSSHAIGSLTRLGWPQDVMCFCVGEATTKRAKAAGLAARKCGDTAQELMQTVLRDTSKGPLFYPRGKHVSFDIAGALREAGRVVDEAVVYDQVETQLTAESLAVLESGQITVVPLFSARSAKLFFEQCPENTKLRIIAISKSVASLVPKTYVNSITVAPNPDAPSMADAVLIAASDAKRLEQGRGAQ